MATQPDAEITRTVQRLIERGSAYDVETLENIYDHDQYILFVRGDGRVDRVGRAETLAEFAARRRSGAPPLSTEAELLYIEQQGKSAVECAMMRPPACTSCGCAEPARAGKSAVKP